MGQKPQTAKVASVFPPHPTTCITIIIVSNEARYVKSKTAALCADKYAMSSPYLV